MNSIDRLTEIFKHFPGIGPKQAKRFVYYLLSRDKSSLDTLTRAISDLKKEVAQCSECMRFYALEGRASARLCNICADDKRDKSLLMIVPRDVDLEAVEKSRSYNGYYFVLGGSLPILEKEPEKRIRIKNLELRIANGLKSGLKEVILAMNANSEGENTADFIKDAFRETGLTFSSLGRGLSTGAELEYADPETLKNALLHRTK